MRLVSQERVQQRTAELIEDAPQFLKETGEMARSVSHERVHQHTAEQIFQLWRCGEKAEVAGWDEGFPSPFLQV